MEKHGCICFPSHCPAAQGCTKTSIKNVVLGPGGDVAGHTKTATAHTHTTQTTTEQPLVHQPNIPEHPCMVSRR